jgi:hypothetical protein
VAENAKLSCDHTPGAIVMHEIMHGIILATVVLTSQWFMHEYFIPTSTLSCIIRTASGGTLSWWFTPLGKLFLQERCFKRVGSPFLCICRVYILSSYPRTPTGPSINAKHREIAIFTLLMFYTTLPLHTPSRLLIYHYQYIFECFLCLGIL